MRMKNFILCFTSLFLILTGVFSPFGFILFYKWLELESKGDDER